MATRSLGTLTVDLIMKLGGFKQGADQATRQFDNTVNKIQNSSKRLFRQLSGFGAVLGASFGIGEIIRATAEAEKAFANLENAVRQNSGAAGQTAKGLADISTELQSVTTFSDDAIQGMQALLLRFQSIGPENFQRATEAVLDLSIALGQDLQSTTRLLGRALEDPARGMTQLSRAGVIFTTQQKEVIKELFETGKAAEAQALLLEGLEKRFAGAAEAARNNFGGALEGLRNAVGDLLEAKGGLPEATKSINDLTKALSNPKTKSAVDLLVSSIIGIGAALATAAAEGIEGINDISDKIADLATKADVEFNILVGGDEGALEDIANDLVKARERLAELQRQSQGADVISKFAFAAEINGIQAHIRSLLRAQQQLQEARDVILFPKGPLTRRAINAPVTVTPQLSIDDQEFLSDLDEALVTELEKIEKKKIQLNKIFEVNPDAVGGLEGYNKALAHLNEELEKAGKKGSKKLGLSDAQREVQAAENSIQSFIDKLQEEQAALGATEADALRYEILHGNIADALTKLDKAADPVRDKLLKLADATSQLKASDAIKKQIQDLEDQAAVLNLTEDQAFEYSITQGALKKQLEDTGDAQKGLTQAYREANDELRRARLEQERRSDIKSILEETQTDLEKYQEKLKKLRGLSVAPKLSLDTSGTDQKIAALQSDLAKIKLPELEAAPTIDLDTEPAERKATALQRKLSGIKAPDLDLTLNAEVVNLKIVVDDDAAKEALDSLARPRETELTVDTSGIKRELDSIEPPELSAAAEVEVAMVVEGAREKLEVLTKPREIDVTIDTQELQQELAAIETPDFDFSVESEVSLDTSDAEQKVSRLQSDLEAIKAPSVDVDASVSIDTAEAQAEVAAFQSDLDSIIAPSIMFDAQATVDVDTDEAQTKVTDLQRSLADIKSVDVDARVSIETDEAINKVVDLQRELDAIETPSIALDAQATVNIDTDAAQRKVAALQSELDAIEAPSIELDAQARVSVDTDEARRQVADLQREMDAISAPEIALDAEARIAIDTTDARAQVDALQRELDSIVVPSVQLAAETRITADVTDAQSKINALQQDLDAIEVPEIELDAEASVGVDIGEAQEEIAALQGQLDSIDVPPIELDAQARVAVDTADATAKVATLQRDLDAIEAPSISVDARARVEIETESAQQQIVNLQRELDAIEVPEIELSAAQVSIDTDDARENVAALQRDLSTIETPVLSVEAETRVTADTADAQAKVAALQRDLDAIEAPSIMLAAETKVTADISDAQGKIAALQQDLDAIAVPEIGLEAQAQVVVDVADAQAKVAALQRDLDSIVVPEIELDAQARIEVDTADARTKVVGLQRELDSIEAPSISVDARARVSIETDEAQQQVAALQRDMDSLRAPELALDVESSVVALDTDDASRKIIALQRDLDELDVPDLAVALDTPGVAKVRATVDVDAAEATLEELTADRDIALSVNTEELEAELDDIEMPDLSSTAQVDVELDAGDMEDDLDQLTRPREVSVTASVARLQAELDSIKIPRVDLPVTADVAVTAHTEEARAQVEALGDLHETATLDVSSTGLGELTVAMTDINTQLATLSTLKAEPEVILRGVDELQTDVADLLASLNTLREQQVTTGVSTEGVDTAIAQLTLLQTQLAQIDSTHATASVGVSGVADMTEKLKDLEVATEAVVLSQQALGRAVADSIIDFIDTGDAAADYAKRLEEIEKQLSGPGDVAAAEAARARVTEVYGQAGADAAKAFKDEARRNSVDIVADILGGDIEGGFTGVLDSFYEMLRQMAIQASAAKIADVLFSGMDEWFAKIGSKLGGLFGGGGSGGGGFGGILDFFAGLFADGGTIRPGQFGIVGEDGPELAFGGQFGKTIAPITDGDDNSSRSSQSIHVHLDAAATRAVSGSRMTSLQFAQDVARQVAVATSRR